MRLSRSVAHALPAARLFPSYSLRRLVFQHRDACIGLGLDATVVDQADDDGVLRWLQDRAGVLPSALAEDLARIDELTNERGAGTLLEVGREAGVDLRGLGLDPLGVAVGALLDHPALFERAHGRRVVETLRSTAEFAGRRPAAPRPFDLTALQALETRLGLQFDERGRSAHCRIVLGRDGDRTVFSVAHGALVRADEALEDAPLLVCDSAAPVYLSERSLRYRPQRRDVVVYDGREGTLRIRASDAPTLNAYRRGFGELLHGDPDWFGDGPVASLEPLVRRGAAIEVPTPGLRNVRLVGLLVRYKLGSVGTVALDSERIWPFLEQRLNSSLDEGELLEATFRVWRVGNPRSALARLRLPNRVEYGRVEEDVFRPWLEARGFLARGAGRLPE
jgi:hypothetical protein